MSKSEYFFTILALFGLLNFGIGLIWAICLIPVPAIRLLLLGLVGFVASVAVLRTTGDS